MPQTKAGARAKSAPAATPALYLNLRPFYIFGLMVLLIIGPLERGLFFRPQLLGAFILIGAAFAFFAGDGALRREKTEVTPLDIAVIGLVLAYALSLITAVHPGEALGGLLKAGACALVYLMAAGASRRRAGAAAVLWSVWLAAAAVAVVGLAAAAGVVSYPGAYVGGRLNSTFQYPNTLASFMIAGSLVSLSLVGLGRRRLSDPVLAAGHTLFLVVVLGSLSRGGWLVYPVGLALLFWLLPADRRMPAVYSLIVSGGCALIGARAFYPRLAAGEPNLIPLVAAVIAACVLQVAASAFLAWVAREEPPARKRQVIAIGLLVYLLVMAGFYLHYAASAFPAATAQLLPSEVIGRSHSMDRSEHSVTQRAQYVNDAIKIIRDYPLTGAGAGGWNALYHQYAATLYYSTETHSSFFQTWVEAGTLGFVAFSAIWVLLLGRVWLFKRKQAREDEQGVYPEVWGAAAAALALVIHSAFDFDMSMGALAFTAFALTGVVRGSGERLGPRRVSAYRISLPPGAVAAAGLVVAVALVYPCLRFYNAGVSGAEAARLLLKKDLQSARPLYEQAIRLDPFTATYRADLAQILAVESVSEDDAVKRYQALASAKAACRLAPYDSRIRSTAANVYSLLGEEEKMLGEYRALQAANPLLPAGYEALGQADIAAAVAFLKEGKVAAAREAALEASELPERFAERGGEASPAMILNRGKAGYLLGNYPAALKDLKEAAAGESKLASDAAVWEAALYARIGRTDDASQALKRAREGVEDADKQAAELARLAIGQ